MSTLNKAYARYRNSKYNLAHSHCLTERKAALGLRNIHLAARAAHRIERALRRALRFRDLRAWRTRANLSHRSQCYEHVANITSVTQPMLASLLFIRHAPVDDMNVS